MSLKNYLFKTSDGDSLVTSDALVFHTADTYYVDDSVISYGGISLFPYDATDFDGNGYAVLYPISGTVRQEKNGVYSTSITVAIDSGDNWKKIQGMAILKIPIRYHDEITYQLFRIYKVTKTMNSSGALRITAEADHIFYDLAWKRLGETLKFAGYGTQIFSAIMASANEASGKDSRFTGVTDFTSAVDPIGFTVDFSKRKSLVAALIDGKDSYIGATDGYLYRDNFYFSINSEMENHRESGMITYAVNMAAIDCQIDYSDICTYVFAEDNYGTTLTHNLESLPANVPVHIYKSITLKYNHESTASGRFTGDVIRWLGVYSKPRISIRIDLHDIENIPLYADFYNLRDYEVGDKVRIYHEGLGVSYYNLEVISKEYDIIHQKTTVIEIGEFRPSVARKEMWYDSITIN